MQPRSFRRFVRDTSGCGSRTHSSNAALQWALWTSALREALANHKQEIMALLRQAEALKSGPASIVPIKPEGRRPPIFAVSGHGADVFWLLPLARHLHIDQPVIGVQPPGLDGSEPLNSIERASELPNRADTQVPAAWALPARRSLRRWSLAFEVAQQLAAAGQEVALLALHRQSVSNDVRASVALVGSPFELCEGAQTRRIHPQTAVTPRTT